MFKLHDVVLSLGFCLFLMASFNGSFVTGIRYSDDERAFKLQITEEHHGNWLAEMIKLNSSKYVRPVKNQSTTLNVTFRLNLYQILGADAVNQIIHLHFWAEMKWDNEFISWDPADFGDIEGLDFESKYMWIPDIMFFNQLSDEHFNEHFPAPPAIHHTGEILVLKPFRVELHCRLEVLHFPFDLQHCEFEVGSWAHFSHEISLVPKLDDNGMIKAADLRFFKKSSIFDLDSFTVKEYTYADPELGNNTFNGLLFAIKFHRFTAYFVINLIMPSFMINVLCIFNFMIPCSSGEKAGYGITVFLAQSVNLMVVMEMMPQGGVSVLGMFLAVSIALIGLSLLMNIITLRVYAPHDATLPPSIRLRKLGKALQLLVGPKEIPPDIVLSQNNFFKLSDSFFDALSVDDLNCNVVSAASGTTLEESYMCHDAENSYLNTKLFDQSGSGSNKGSGVPGLQSTNQNQYVPINHQNGIKSKRRFVTSQGKPVSPLSKRIFMGQNDFEFMQREAKKARIDPMAHLSQTHAEFFDDRPLPAYRTQKFREESQRRSLFDAFEDPTLRSNTHNYSAEYQFLAETINRFNAIIFSILLLLTCGLYWFFHDPRTFSVDFETH